MMPAPLPALTGQFHPLKPLHMEALTAVFPGSTGEKGGGVELAAFHRCPNPGHFLVTKVGQGRSSSLGWGRWLSNG